MAHNFARPDKKSLNGKLLLRGPGKAGILPSFVGLYGTVLIVI